MTTKRPRDGDYIDGTEGLVDSKGNEITSAYLAELAEEAERGFEGQVEVVILGPGRPSLTGERRHSPRVSFRMTDDMRERAEAEAARRGMTMSQLAREALELLLAS